MAAQGGSCDIHAQHGPSTLFEEPLEEAKTHRQQPELRTKPSQLKRKDAKNLNQNCRARGQLPQQGWALPAHQARENIQFGVLRSVGWDSALARGMPSQAQTLPPQEEKVLWGLGLWRQLGNDPPERRHCLGRKGHHSCK